MDEPQTLPAPTVPSKAPYTLGRFISTQNPFYLISALLVLWGIWLSILPTLEIEHVIALWGITVGYIVLVSISTIAVIRLAHDWSDARTLLLIIPLFCTVLSMLFDELLLGKSFEASAMLMLGFIFSVICFEGVIWQTRIKLVSSIRWIYHLLMATLFAYPVLLQIVLKFSNGSAITVTVLSLFPVVISLEFVLLAFATPALYRLRESSGTPYPFPLYPLSLFAVLLVVCMFRLYLLALAFAPGWNYTLVQPSNFIPFVFAAGLVVVEINHQKRSTQAQLCSFVAGIVTLYLSYGLTPELSHPEVIGPNREMTSWLVAGYYLWLSRRNVSLADYGVAVAFASLYFVPSSKAMFIPWYVALSLTAVYLIWRGWKKESGSRLAVASVLAGMVLAFFLPEFEFIARPFVVVNLACFCFLSLVPLIRFDWLEEGRNLALYVLGACYLFTLQENCIPEFMVHWKEWLIYSGLLSVLLLVYGWLFRSKNASYLALSVIGVNMALSALPFIHWLRTTFLGRGLIPLLIGLGSLGLGVAVTFAKAAKRRQGSAANGSG